MTNQPADDRQTPSLGEQPRADLRSAPTMNEELRRLEEIVRRLEASDVDLDDALTLFEDGIARLRACRERLQAAESRVQQVLEQADGTLRWQDLEG